MREVKEKVGVSAVIICSLDQAVSALKAARRQNCDLLLLSAPGAAASTGAAVFKAMTDQAALTCPGVPFTAALDCGSDAGHALAAIREGVRAIVLSQACPACDRIADIARRNDVQLLSPDVYGDQGFGEPRDLTLEVDAISASHVAGMPS